MNLEGARALVTGASRGIGRALCAALRDAGSEVFGAARTAGAGVRACDVRDPDAVAALREATGPVDVLVNNAAVIHGPAPVVDLPLDEWRRLLDTNVVGLVAVMKAYLPAMNERGRGVVLNLSSGWGRHGVARQAPYCATKFAVEGLTQAVAGEVAPGVAVCAVNPGTVATEMLATCFERDVGGYTPPEQCAASFVRLLGALDPGWNGRSLDADAF